jgi:hypothetical protein
LRLTVNHLGVIKKVPGAVALGTFFL